MDNFLSYGRFTSKVEDKIALSDVTAPICNKIAVVQIFDFLNH